MPGIFTLLTSFDGRIGRSQFWLGAICILVLSTVIAVIMMMVGFRQVHSISGTVQLSTGETREFANTSMTLMPWAAFVLSLITAVPTMAIGVKRRHDRDFSGVDVIAFVAVTVFMQFLQALGVANGELMSALSVVVAVWILCLLILRGFLKGTPGRNKYGPDPLAWVAVPAQ